MAIHEMGSNRYRFPILITWVQDTMAGMECDDDSSVVLTAYGCGHHLDVQTPGERDWLCYPKTRN